uniref:dTDP-4-amino-4,6-dideoxygalactose transaminase n=1 Tax=Candidatus Kentrum sp. MB TaxID=2138164 RepID=A0A450XI76_9GAMM|nr:MAG: dTDP-4-amino-4,6-dideoxygalactose transaminase [Candidatus Kentron sp. MB]VFK29545.1 MAG: dTDP-4-amino-4,6-dideoxygalactose transaminase [Candidatus Kentron sp. MB]VFK74822.1 MAG: dTDP-4-amino-4,6-dideoxygalactose transaminase [Candidatus Kentron sp. MB]
MQFIDLKAQQDRIRPQLDAALRRVLDHGRYILGPEVAQLEQRLAEFTGAKHCIACANGTDALLLGLMACQVGPGDAVITTPFTFFATAEMIALTGATPIFVDIQPDTYNIDPNKIAEAIQRFEKTDSLNLKGIITVDLFGLPADYQQIMPLAKAHDLFVLQDAAQAFGAEADGKKSPTHGDVGTTSFFPAKPLGCYGDGGAVFTDDDALADTIRSLRVHGQGSDKYNNTRIGINSRMDTMQAAILLEKFRLYPEEIELRQRIADGYHALLAGRYKRQWVPAGFRSVWAQYCLESAHREKAMARLEEAGIPSMIYYRKPLHLLKAFNGLGHGEGDFPVAEAASRNIFALPMHPYLSEEDIHRICEVLNGV